ncbi:phosphoenolpyruvate synthase [Vibrio brasiliensis]|uniref:phosphoenolpyruvate synthase n=1 Tax=Vibrio brasiliensis TaxID=170652 RepID=UPI001EFE44B3|nr:phosphoenolpyruvate synthase [Vibrio brasiliensis]MCG9651075.1 phosphoenolpyruvate synthase [Vibrio brasiliensis]
MESNQPLNQAINNNLIWCQTVAKLHQINGEQRQAYWQASATMPTFFPNLVTLKPQLTSEAIIADLPKQGTFFIKDSFAQLDLESAQFIKLFDAMWYCASQLANLTKSDTETKVTAVTDAESLKQWEQLWRGEESFEPVYPEVFLDDSAIGFLFAENDDKLAGISYFFNGQSVGIYNLWGEQTLFAELIAYISTLYPETPIVGYGDEDELCQLQPLGFEPLAPLSVWGRFE